MKPFALTLSFLIATAFIPVTAAAMVVQTAYSQEQNMDKERTDITLDHLQKRWGEIKYNNTSDKQKQRDMHTLASVADELIKEQPNLAEAYLWSGIVRSSEAELIGGLSALGLVKAAKKDFEKVIELDAAPEVTSLAHTYLGALYYNVPGWPLAFGDDEKAIEHLEIALDITPKSMNGHYFYGIYYEREGEMDKAIKYYREALDMPISRGFDLVGEGRVKEIREALARVRNADDENGGNGHRNAFPD